MGKQVKNLLISALSAAALLVAAPLAHADATGYVGVQWNHTSPDVDGADPDDVDGGSVEGAFASEISPGLGAEFNAAYADANHVNGTNIAGHLYAKNAGSKIGGFVGVGDIAGSHAWVVGAEGAVMVTPNIDLLGALSYGEVADGDDGTFGADIVGRWLVSDDWRVDARAGYAKTDTNLGALGDDAWRAGLGTEYKLANSPVSFFGRYDHADSDHIAADAFSLGVRYAFGGATLRDREENGPVFTDVPTFASAYGNYAF